MGNVLMKSLFGKNYGEIELVKLPKNIKFLHFTKIDEHHAIPFWYRIKVEYTELEALKWVGGEIIQARVVIKTGKLTIYKDVVNGREGYYGPLSWNMSNGQIACYMPLSK